MTNLPFGIGAASDSRKLGTGASVVLGWAKIVCARVSSFRSLARQYFQYGSYKVRVLQKRGELASPRALVPPAFVLGLGGSLALLALGRSKPLAVLAVPYVGASLLASAVAGRDVPAAAPVLPVVFATIHVSYGSGFLTGLWRWRMHWRRHG